VTQQLSDLLLLGATACNAPAAVLALPTPLRGWSTLSRGIMAGGDIATDVLFKLLANASGPLELSDLSGNLPHSNFALPPRDMHWAYGTSLRNPDSRLIGVLAILDRVARKASSREELALAALTQQIERVLSDQLPPHPKEPGPHQSDPTSNARTWLNAADVAAILRVNERTIRNWSNAGKLPVVRTPEGHHRFCYQDVTALLTDQLH
jgi:hypothetical protein